VSAEPNEGDKGKEVDEKERIESKERETQRGPNPKPLDSAPIAYLHCLPLCLEALACFFTPPRANEKTPTWLKIDQV
jgi:hypothetical protein